MSCTDLCRRLLVLCLLFALLISHAAVAVGAVAAEDALPSDKEIASSLQDSSAAVGNADFSDPAFEAANEWSASALITALTGETLSDVERTYVDSMLAGAPFVYSDAIPPRAVTTTYRSDTQTLTVTASPYIYTAENGETVTWLPATATLGERSIPLAPHGNDGTLRGALTEVAEEEPPALTVSYACTLIVPASVADGYLTYAWNYAYRLNTEKKAYESALAAYDKYQSYLSDKAAYDKAYAEYQVYLAAKAKYDKALAAYNGYLAAKAQYQKDLAAYQTYLVQLKRYEAKKETYEKAYAAYVAELNAYKAALPAYLTYKGQVDQINDCMATVNSIFVPNSEGKLMYATLMGDTVAMVVDRKNELIAAGCDTAAIDTAAASTDVLRILLTEYKGLATPAEKLAYYQAHYTEIRQGFVDLYGALASLYKVDIVKSALINFDRLERFIEFLSQLYVISSGLDDTRNRDDTWHVFGRYDSAYYGETIHYIHTELEPVQIPADKNNANPAGLVYPTPAVAEPKAPAPLTMQEPVPPTEVTYPVEPDVVLKPTPPATVARPTEPTPVEDPGEKPIAPSYTSLQSALLQAYLSRTLPKRETGRERTLTFASTLQKVLSFEKCPVTFYDADGKTVLYTALLDAGAPIVYGGDTPTREDTPKYTYAFVGWKDKDGHLLTDLGTASGEDNTFYASYKTDLRAYTVTWLCEGERVTETLPYGTIPLYPHETPSKDSTDQYNYVFGGWQIPDEEGWGHDLAAVQGDVTYQAVFEAVLRRYAVTFIYNEGEVETTLWDYGTTPVPQKAPLRAEDDRYLYVFRGWDTDLASVTGDTTYTALYEALPILPPAQGSTSRPQALILRDSVYSAVVPTGGLQVDRLISLSLLRDRTLSLISSDLALSLQFNEAILYDLQTAGCTYLEVAPAPAVAGGTGYTIRFLNASREEITLSYPITTRYTAADAHIRAYTQASDGTLTALPYTYEDGVLSTKIAGSTTLCLLGEYAVTLAPCENGILTADRLVALTGDKVTLTLTHSDDYQIEEVVVKGTLSGTLYPLCEGESLAFIMPDEPVTVSATLTLRRFTVSFVVDGVVISESVYGYGDTVTLPADPTKDPVTDERGEIIYLFVGWSPIVTAVTEDVVYTAVFSESIQGDNQDYILPSHGIQGFLLLALYALALLEVVAIVVILIVLVKKKRKKKKRPPFLKKRWGQKTC